jgi:hypothetical protein
LAVVASCKLEAGSPSGSHTEVLFGVQLQISKRYFMVTALKIMLGLKIETGLATVDRCICWVFKFKTGLSLC